jgi:hypothetical protein
MDRTARVPRFFVPEEISCSEVVPPELVGLRSKAVARLTAEVSEAG